MAKLIRINPLDNVAVAVHDIPAGEECYMDGENISAAEDIPAGHKMALRDIAEGEDIIKYGFPIGHLIKPAGKGGLIDHNILKTNLDGVLEYSYSPALSPIPAAASEATFKGFRRSDGQAGIRNELWIIPTVGCVNGVAAAICERFRSEMSGYPSIEAVKAFTHNYGCSQLGDDHRNTKQILADMVHHPNAAGVLVVSLGCENNQLAAFRELVGNVDEDRVRPGIALRSSPQMNSAPRTPSVTFLVSSVAHRPFRSDMISGSSFGTISASPLFPPR